MNRAKERKVKLYRNGSNRLIDRLHVGHVIDGFLHSPISHT